MKEKEESVKKLFIPSNIETEKQILDGIGITEVIFIVSVFFATLAITVILKMLIDLNGTIMGFVLLSSLGISYMFAKRDDNNMSFLRLIISFYNFISSKKKYKLIYESDWLNGDF